ncbi:MAG: lactate utilization protein [Oscillospiraceae bacterium]|nr:lactate utilization protein [Oscillospiraceae bacterium]
MKPQILEALKKMEKFGYHTHVFPTAVEMRDFVMSSIPETASVGFGGSMTVTGDIRLYDLMKERGNTCFYHGRVEPEEAAATRKKAMLADYYLTSSNAVTYDGKLLNIDGVGNRVGALCCGPDIVYILVGVNKFAPDDEAAMKRCKEVACVKNGVRLDTGTPCAVTGKCADCNSPNRMCRAVLWLERVPREREFHICVADEALGY